MIECRGVSVNVGGFELRDVTFSIPKGAHAILTGPTASGKTTLIETIAGALAPSCGSVIVNGIDVTQMGPELRDIALVHQRGLLFPHLDVAQNVAYGAQNKDETMELMRRFGIADLSRRSVRSLSGGERQLVALCRAIAARKSALLLDEPFSALDPVRRRETASMLSAIATERRVTVLHATHDSAEVPGNTYDLHVTEAGVVEAGRT